MKYSFSIFLFLCLVHLSYAQRVFLDFGLKSCIAAGRDIKKVYGGVGGGIQADFGFNLLKNRKLNVNTSFFTNTFRNQYATPAINSVSFLAAGVGLGYTFTPKERVKIIPFIKWHRASLDESIAPAKGYYGENLSLMKGKGSMWSSGVRFGYKALFLEGSYSLYSPLCIPTNQMIDKLSNGYQVYQLLNIVPVRLNMNTFQLGIGVFTNGMSQHKK